MFVFLLTDIFFYIIIFSLGYYVYYVRKTKDILETWKHVFKSKTGIISITVLAFFLLIAILEAEENQKPLEDINTSFFQSLYFVFVFQRTKQLNPPLQFFLSGPIRITFSL